MPARSECTKGKMLWLGIILYSVSALDHYSKDSLATCPQLQLSLKTSDKPTSMHGCTCRSQHKFMPARNKRTRGKPLWLEIILGAWSHSTTSCYSKASVATCPQLQLSLKTSDNLEGVRSQK